MVSALAPLAPLAPLTWFLMAFPVGAPAPHPPPRPPRIETEVLPFLRTHCVECHGGRKTEADLNLLRVVNERRAGAALWRDVRDMLLLGEMPPEGQPAPTEQERALVLEWISRTLAALPEERPPASLRRLSRFEYENTIRDLLGVHFDAARWLPFDEVGNGFDNQTAALALSDLSFEKFFEAAEEIASRAIVDDAPAGPAVRRYLPLEMNGTTKGHQIRPTLFSLSTNGAARFDVPLQGGGVYRLRVRAHADQAGPEPARMQLRADGRVLKTFDVQAASGQPAVQVVRAELKAGEHSLEVAFINDYYAPADPDPGDRDRNLHLHWVEVEGPLGPPAESVFLRRLLDSVRGRPDPLAAALSQIATRAWRRPVTDSELWRLLALARPGEPLSRSLRRALAAILVSPHFLFRVEPLKEEALDKASLEPMPLATRLSYFLWSSMPDAELFRAAREGGLDRPEQRAAEVRRMLRDARSSALVSSFAGQWLKLGQLERAEPDPRTFPDFDADLEQALFLETTRLFEAVLREGLGVRTLLTADFTFLNERSARHYGIEGVAGRHLRRVPLPPGHASGLLAHAGILTLTSEPNRTSAVKRGKWVLEVLLDQPPPPPPPSVTALEQSAPAERGGTLRQRMERHREDPDCASCHATMDPIGFGLENYGPTGRFRMLDNGLPIDASGVLPDGRSFDGPDELRALIAADSAFVKSLARHLAVYALGRALSAAERIDLEERLEPLGQDPTLFDLILCIVELDAFRGVSTRSTLPNKRLPA